MRNNEAQRESRRRDKMEKELKQAKADHEAKSNDVKNLVSAIDRYKADVNKLEQQLKEQRVSTVWIRAKLNNSSRNEMDAFGN